MQKFVLLYGKGNDTEQVAFSAARTERGRSVKVPVQGKGEAVRTARGEKAQIIKRWVLTAFAASTLQSRMHKSRGAPVTAQSL